MKPRSFLAAFVLMFSLATGLAYANEPMPVNINTADAVTLSALSGVGQVKAEAIVTYREAHGPFGSVEELAEVTGIGARTIENNADRITVE